MWSSWATTKRPQWCHQFAIWNRKITKDVRYFRFITLNSEEENQVLPVWLQNHRPTFLQPRKSDCSSVFEEFTWIIVHWFPWDWTVCNWLITILFFARVNQCWPNLSQKLQNRPNMLSFIYIHMITWYMILYLQIILNCLAMLSTYLITRCCGCLHCQCLSFDGWILGPGYYRWSIKHVKKWIASGRQRSIFEQVSRSRRKGNEGLGLK